MKKKLLQLIDILFLNNYIRLFFKKIFNILERILNKIDTKETLSLDNDLNIEEIKKSTISYIKSLCVKKNNTLLGYKHSHSCTKTNLYSLISVLLIKHLFKIEEDTEKEINILKNFQFKDGIFRDKNIDCSYAETGDDWGWRHLTLHALMTLDLYSIKSNYPIKLALDLDLTNIKKKLLAFDWNTKLPWTSNAVQNLSVFLQYNRKYFNQNNADEVLKIIIEFINSKQSKETGLFLDKFENFNQLSDSVQSAYHFWLIYFSEDIEINYMEKIIDNVLKTQNFIGGFGYKLNSSACEDIDSIDILLRLSKKTKYRFNEIKDCLNKSIPAILNNLNRDGGWVFRRDESLKIVHNEMFSFKNESNLFYTWFRLLAFCYSSTYSDNFKYDWNLLDKKIGHQFKNW